MKTRYMNPYLAGFLLGLVLLATIYITGHGLGASGSLKSAVVATVNAVAPNHVANTPYFKHYLDGQSGSPLKAWLVFEVVGVLVGGFLSGVIAKRLTFETEHPPHVKGRTRLAGAMIGGLLFGIGSQLARGCTSGAALSGMAVLSTGGFITMLAIFGSAYAVAYFVRKLWI
jgi:uncharacterized protein